MTENKQFIVDNEKVMQNGETYVVCDGRHNADVVASALNELLTENEQLKKEKEYWKGDACSQSSYLSILSMDCSIVEEAIFNLKNVIDVDTEAYNLLDELSDKFDELQEHRINWGYNLSEEEKQDVIKYLRAYND